MNFEFCSQAFEKDPNPYLYEGGSFLGYFSKVVATFNHVGGAGGLFKWRHALLAAALSIAL